MPCPDIKVEEEELEASVTPESPNNEATFDSNIDPTPSTSRRESLLETATKMFSPSKKKKPMTRLQRLDTGLELEPQSGETLNRNLREAEKSKKKPQKKK